MNPRAAFTELCLNHKLAEIHGFMNLLLKIAMMTDNGFFDEVADREAAYLMADNMLRCLDEAYRLASGRTLT